MFFNSKKKQGNPTKAFPYAKMHHCLNPQAFTINTNYTLSCLAFFLMPFSSYHLSLFSLKSHLKTLTKQTKTHKFICLFDHIVRSGSLSSFVLKSRIIDLDHLATLTREKCSALVRSCYVPSKTTCSDDIISERNTKVEDGLGFRGGGRRRLPNNQPSKRHGGGRSCTAVSSEPCHLKSNLKIKAEADKVLEQRKVSWPDAHGEDIAHVQEFELSASEDGERAGKSKRKYCGVCIIQ